MLHQNCDVVVDFFVAENCNWWNEYDHITELLQLMIWWSGSKDDVFPWSPKPEQRANILVYSLDQ